MAAVCLSCQSGYLTPPARPKTESSHKMTCAKVAPKSSPIYAEAETLILHRVLYWREEATQNTEHFMVWKQLGKGSEITEPGLTWNMQKNQSMKYENYAAKNSIQSCLPYGAACLMSTAHTSVSGPATSARAMPSTCLSTLILSYCTPIQDFHFCWIPPFWLLPVSPKVPLALGFVPAVQWFAAVEENNCKARDHLRPRSMKSLSLVVVVGVYFVFCVVPCSHFVAFIWKLDF